MILRRLSDWFDRHPAAGDALVVLALAYPLLAASASVTEADQSEGWYLLWGLSYLVPLLWRRTRPDLAAGLLVLPHLLQLAVLDTFTPANATVPIVLYAVAAHGRHPRWWLVGSFVAAAVAACEAHPAFIEAVPERTVVIAKGRAVLRASQSPNHRRRKMKRRRR